MQNPIDFLAIFSRYIIDFLILFLFLRVILSWFPIPRGRFTQFLTDVTNPILRPIQKLRFSRLGMLDLSPILAYLFLALLNSLLGQLFLKLGANPAIYPF